MARCRMVKPEMFTSKTLARVSREARYTFVGLWTECDDMGVMIDCPKKIAGVLFPYDDDVDARMMDQWLNELSAVGLIARGEKNNKDFIIITGWDEHQKVDRPSKFSWLTRPERDELATHSRHTRDSLDVQYEKEKETEKETENNILSASVEALRDTDQPAALPAKPSAKKTEAEHPAFTVAMQHYPKRLGDNSRPKAARAFSARIKSGEDPEILVAGTMRYAAFCDSTHKTGTEFVKQAATFFGPDRPYLLAWDSPVAARQQATHSAVARFLHQEEYIDAAV